MADLLLELFSEEIPARMQAKAAEDLKRLVTEGLVERGLTYAHAAAFATPRRLALAIEGLAEASMPRREERKGPRVDAPEAAVQGFLRATGLTLDRLEQRDDKKARVFVAVVSHPGRPAAGIVAETVEAAVRGFPWQKSMRWGDGALRWVRPLQSILCILSRETGSEVVPLDIDGIVAGDITRGHRFHAPGPIRVSSFEDYRAKLARAFVILDPAERAAKVAHDATQLAFARGLDLVEDAGLLAENAGLTEWPVCLIGEIEPRFLDLPPEVLQTSMRANQKFFSLRYPGSGRITAYVLVANRDTADDGTTIRAGNARVLTARLADAEFFWRNDLRRPLADMAAKLAAVTFHGKLGTQAERIARIAALAREIAPAVGADPDLAERAAKLAKADLASQMVYEFPELQGVMGRYYAERAGEPPEVAAAAPEHYAPLGPSDAVPTAPVSVAVALADKLDTLAGFWLVAELPTGSKDPFALRRAAIGIVRLVLENEIRIDVRDAVLSGVQILMTGIPAPVTNNDRHELESLSRPIAQSFMLRDESEKNIHERTLERYGWTYHLSSSGLREDILDQMWLPEEADHIQRYSARYMECAKIARRIRQGSVPIPHSEWGMLAPEMRLFAGGIGKSLLGFLFDRLKVFLRDQGIRHDVIDACIAMPGNDDLVLLVARVRTLQGFLASEDGANLLTGYKRAANILAAEEKKDGVEYSLDPNPRLAETEAERALFAALDAAGPALGPALEAEDFAGAMTVLAGLRAPIDAFFDTTVVNAESPVVRRNRLCLLNRIRVVMNRVAVFGEIEGA